MDNIKVFAPATVANVGPGFDVLGLALDGIGDELEVKKNDTGNITIHPIEGFEDLPTDPKKNVIGVAIEALLKDAGMQQGFEITVLKRVMPGSGLGSSASSSAAAVFAANELIGKPFSKAQLVKYAMEGERCASGKAHADNVTPALLGGFTIVRSYSPLDVVNVPFPKDLFVAVVHPQIEVKTSDSKKILKKDVSLETAVAQWGNVAGLITGLATNDYGLIGRSLDDYIVEPIRSVLIPGYAEAKALAIENGALGCSISGSGPSIFALTEGKAAAENIGSIFSEYYSKIDIDHKVYVSAINAEGAKVL